MTDWNAQLYLKFQEGRTRAARDLLAQVPLERAARIIDLGCGPGNSTELLVARYRDADVVGVDSSPDMLTQARKRLPACRFVNADLSTWTSADRVDLLFASGVFQWVPDHRSVLSRLVKALSEGGVLAIQIPDITEIPSVMIMRNVANRGPWGNNSGVERAIREQMPRPESYYDLLKPLCAHVDVWRTSYHYVLPGPEAVVEYFKGVTLRPLLSALDDNAAEAFLTAYSAEIERHHGRRVDGCVLLELPRLFVVATR
jgi:trans-aconitate 2-methyltransferase